jgi:protein phosphatase
MTELTLPELSLVVLVGVSGSGKSTFARAHFLGTEVISSDFCRGLVSDDENDQAATRDAFEVLQFIAGKRLAARRLTVVDATNVQPEARKQLIDLARAHDVLATAIVLDQSEAVCIERNAARQDRTFGADVIRRQSQQLKRSVRHLQKEGFRRVQVLHGQEEIAAATIVREPLWTDKRSDSGPFDVIGDVHGCRNELESLLADLGYLLHRNLSGQAIDAEHPEGRRVIFLGYLVDRGPDTPGVLRLAMGMGMAGHALGVSGNHENKLGRALGGKKVTVSHGLAESLAQIDEQTPDFRSEVARFIDGLISHYVLDEGRLVVAHAGLKEAYQNRSSGRVRSFALYGETTGETDEYGLPVRYPWAEDYRGRATVLYGHTPVPGIEWVNNTLCLDTGCVFGGRLSALRWPERAVVSVPAEQVWYEPVKPLAPTVTVRDARILKLDDVAGKRVVETHLHGRISIREENAAAALEVMSRFAVDPRWLLYLPPTMSPVATSSREGLLEHPDEAFSQLAGGGVVEVICEEKHMGSRAVVLVCRDAPVARDRFGVGDGSTGVVVTRTGRAFFSDGALTEGLLAGVRSAVDASGLWDELDTGWLLLDVELLP